MSTVKHANIPVFIPHLGCPNQCVFCDQRTISGVCTFREDDVKMQIESALETIKGSGRTAEIAFFGGSFTGIDRSLMIRLLDLAETYVKAGLVSGIRMSTRPDYIDAEVVNILGNYTVSKVELGIQSMTDRVLAASKRGHTAKATLTACRLLREAGLSVVGQMMIGLPSSCGEDEIRCAEAICVAGCTGARIYPALVLRGTELCEMTQKGEYTPLSIEDAVNRSADVLEVFNKYGVKCLRIGLCDSEALHAEEKYFAGPSHPAMGELVRGEIYRRRIEKKMSLAVIGKVTVIEVPTGAVSAAAGQNGANRKLFESKYKTKIKYKENSALEEFSVNINRE